MKKLLLLALILIFVLVGGGAALLNGSWVQHQQAIYHPLMNPSVAITASTTEAVAGACRFKAEIVTRPVRLANTDQEIKEAKCH